MYFLSTRHALIQSTYMLKGMQAPGAHSFFT